MKGIAQNEQKRLQPSDIFTYSLGPAFNRGGLAETSQTSSGMGASNNSSSFMAIEFSSAQGTKRSGSVNSSMSSSPKRAGRQPETTSFIRPLSTEGRLATSKMTSKFSSIASRKNEQVLTMIASSASVVQPLPSSASSSSS